MSRETQQVRRVQARSHQPSGGALWLGPAIGLGLGLCGLLAFGLTLVLRPSTADQSAAIRPTAILMTITPSPVITTATLSPTRPPSPTPPDLYIGGTAVVAGTGSVLRLRSDPGLQTTTLKTVVDGTRLTILEGPREADGLIWWRLHDP